MKKQTPCGRSRTIGAFNGRGRKEEKLEKEAIHVQISKK